MTLLICTDIVAGYSSGDEILKGVNFAVGRGEIVAIIGPNGAGKSTLLKAIAGLLRPSRGAVVLDGRPINGLTPREIAQSGVAFVPQEANIFPALSVRENLEIGGYLDPASIWRSSAFPCWPRSGIARHGPCPAGNGRCWRWRRR